MVKCNNVVTFIYLCHYCIFYFYINKGVIMSDFYIRFIQSELSFPINLFTHTHTHIWIQEIDGETKFTMYES